MKGSKTAGVVAGIAGLFSRRRGLETGNLRKGGLERGLAVITGTALVMSLMVVVASPALAHHPILEVSAACDDQGNKVVTWTVANGNWEGRTMTLSQVQHTDGTAGWSTIAAGLSLAPNGSAQQSVTYGLSEIGTKTLSVTAGWSDGGPQGVSDSLSIELNELECEESTSTTTQPDETTTTEATTTTTEASTTTTQQETTTSVNNFVNPTNQGTPPDETTSTVDDSVLGTVVTTTVADEVDALEVLPFTGSDNVALITLAASAIALGAILVLSARREQQ
jgi:hypothetical protein